MIPCPEAPMTEADVLERVEHIEAARGDDEVAHEMEDVLHKYVLWAIARQACKDPVACARAALKTAEIDFARWYA